MAIKLTIISLATDDENMPSEQIFNKDSIMIGRSNNADLTLDDDEISATHAIISLENGELYVQDLGSLNGTIIENRRITSNSKNKINKKERLMIGEFLIKPEIIEDENEKIGYQTNEDDFNTNDDKPETYKEEFQQILNETENGLINETQDSNSFEELENNSDELSTPNPIILDDDKIFDEGTNGDDDNQNDSLDIFSSKIEEEIFNTPDPTTDKIPTLDDSVFDINNENEGKILEDSNNEKEPRKEEIILMQGANLVRENIENFTPQKEEANEDNDNFLIISGTADESAFNINLEAIKLLTLTGKCKRFGHGIDDVKISLNGQEILTDANGNFKFSNLEEGDNITLNVEKNGYIFKLVNIPDKILSDTNIDIEGAKVFSIKGKIVYKNKGLENVIIKNNLQDNIITSKNGSFTINDIVEGTKFSLSPIKENYIFEFDNEEKTLNEDYNVTIQATKLISISGYIKYKGMPICDVIIDGGILGKTLTDDNGFYEFKGVKEGTNYTLKAYKEGFKFQKA